MASEPKVKLVYPDCMKVDMFDIQFNHGMIYILTDDTEEQDLMTDKFKHIHKQQMQKLKPEPNKAAEWQSDMINTIIL